MSVSVKKDLEKEKENLDLYLEKVLSSDREDPAELFRAARYAVFSGGKRIRPLLLLHVHELCGGERDKALPAAAAVELIHAFSLVQDDLPAMDDDDTRRGKPTLHKAFGEAVALLASDHLLLRAVQLLVENYEPATVSSVIDSIGPAGLLGGQILDLAWQDSQAPPETMNEIRLRKTAALFEISFRLGASTAGCREERLELVSEYGRLFGLAFQLWDDIHDTPGTSGRKKMKKEMDLVFERLRTLGSETGLESPVLDFFLDFLGQSAGEKIG